MSAVAIALTFRAARAGDVRAITALINSAQRLWGVTRMSMSVISLRRDLIGWYERRGYALTGAIKPLPLEDGLCTALVEGLELAVMEKQLPELP